MKILQRIWKAAQWIYRTFIKKPAVYIWSRLKAERVQ